VVLTISFSRFINLINTEDTVFVDFFIDTFYGVKYCSRNMLIDCMIHTSSIPLALHGCSTAQEIYCVYGT
jgi:hypothetical protein